MRKYRAFNEARKFACSLNFKGVNDWYKFCLSGNRPSDIPSNPSQVYKDKGWNGFGDFLGTGNMAPGTKEHRPFEDARKFAHSLKLKDQKQWGAFAKSSKKPDDIPATPYQVYKNKGWKGYGDWLGTGNIGWREKHEQIRNFEDARKFVHSLKLKSMNEYRKYCKSGEKPDDIPYAPNTVYKNDGWVSFGDWVGTGRIADQYKEFRPFEDARKFVCSLNLKSDAEWKQYCKSGKKPNDIPAAPQQVYKKEYKGLGDWLGTGTIAPFNKKYRPFEDTRKFVRSLGVETETEWHNWCKTHQKPDDISLSLHKTYKNKGWKGWRNFLGPRRARWKSFEECRKFARSLKLKSVDDWVAYWKTHKRPNDIPSGPFQVYKKDWKGWNSFLGTGNLNAQQRHEQHYSYEDASKYVRKLGIKSSTEFQKWADRPMFIPSSPWATYKKEWIDWSEFLGTHKRGTHPPFNEARKFAQSLNLKFNSDWFRLHKEGKIPDDIPAYVNETYAKEGWEGWGDFLGTGHLSPSDARKQFKSFEECKAFVRSLGIKTETEWRDWCKNNKRPKGIPYGFERSYPDQWTTMGEFLGTGVIADKFKIDIWLPLKQAKPEARRIAKELGITTKKQWLEAHRAGKIPNLPLHPDSFYNRNRKRSKKK